MNPSELYSNSPREIESVRTYPMDKPEESAANALRANQCAPVQGTLLAHLTGPQCSMGIEMLAGPEALIPRKETEILGGAALDVLRETAAANGNALVIDLCTGCGNLALALAYHEPACQVFAADLSPEAVDLARRNAEYLAPQSPAIQERVTFAVGDLFEPFDDARFVGRVDIVICNPPYISSRRVDEMAAEVSDYEPRLAFDGGPFGVSVLVRLLAEAPRYLKPGGWLCFEVGLGQGDLIRRRLERSSEYGAIETRSDPDGHPRALLARRV